MAVVLTDIWIAYDFPIHNDGTMIAEFANGNEGTAVVGFTVNEDGAISDPKIVRGLCETCDKEAIRLIENMPKWEPAKQNGQALKERMVLPINFAKENPYEKTNAVSH